MLDICCGAGGAAVGYDASGWEVIGWDINDQPNYPFEFHKGDGVEAIKEHGHKVDAVHMSWPCQRYSLLTQGTNKGREYPDLIPAGREAANASGKPWVIENVAGSPIRKDLMLCGEMFGLKVLRHRFFEFGNGASAEQPFHGKHRGRVSGWRHGKWYDGPYFQVYGSGGGKGTVEQWQDAMGIDWTDNRKEIAEAIPPAYTLYIGAELRRTLKLGD